MQRGLHTRVSCVAIAACTTQTTPRAPFQKLPVPDTWPPSKWAKVFNNICFPPFHRSVLVINCQCSSERFIVKGSAENICAKLTTSTLLLFRRDSPCDVGAKKFLHLKHAFYLCKIMVPQFLAAFQWHLHTKRFVHSQNKQDQEANCTDSRHYFASANLWTVSSQILLRFIQARELLPNSSGRISSSIPL